MLSECCNKEAFATLGDGVLVGWCAGCNKPVCRANPKTGETEWLDGHDPWTKEPLRPATPEVVL